MVMMAMRFATPVRLLRVTVTPSRRRSPVAVGVIVRVAVDRAGGVEWWPLSFRPWLLPVCLRVKDAST